MDSTYQVNQDWRKLANQIVKSQQMVLVIGATDTGKSTFCRYLADYALAAGRKVACVDADIGQSGIGPPNDSRYEILRTGRTDRSREPYRL